MARDKAAKSLLRLTRRFRHLDLADSSSQFLSPNISRLHRSMATVVEHSSHHNNVSADARSTNNTAKNSRAIVVRPLEHDVLTTLYQWPSMEPVRYQSYPSKHLDLPLRRDILHRAVIFEGDATRQGTASTKWRDDVHGSGRKVLPQKGTGKARAGDKKSPIRRGGGVAFGPHPRDFSTELNRKIYDLAWRTALSYRYRKGELIVTDNNISVPWDSTPHLLNSFFEQNQWGQGFGRSTLVTLNGRQHLNKMVDQLGHHAVVKDLFDVDVKDLLETGRIIIERFALDALIAAHKSDLERSMSLEKAQAHQQHLAKLHRQQLMAKEEEQVIEEEIQEPELDVHAAQEQVENMGR